MNDTNEDPRPERSAEAGESPPARKKPYLTPHLTVYGGIEEITGNIGFSGSDGLSGSGF